MNQTMETKAPIRLRRSTDDKVIAGVCGGLGVYFGVDPLFFRLAFVVLAIGGGSGVLLYIVAWLIMPEVSEDGHEQGRAVQLGSSGPMLAGIALITVGLMLLMNNLLPWFDRLMLPLVVVGVGFGLLLTGGRRDRS